MKEILENQYFINTLYSILTIIISFIIYFIISKTINKTRLGKKSIVTKIKLLIKYLIIIITLILIAEIYGLNLSSLLTSLGVISIIVGFAIQDALKDIIRGIVILSDNYYKVGDVIKYNNITGKVLSIGLKTTKVEDVNTLNKVSISNRLIEEVEIVSNLINIDIPLPYELEVEKAEKVISTITKLIEKEEEVSSCEYRGINKLDSSSINYQIKVYTNPINKNQVRRNSLVIIMKELTKNNIPVPYTQIDIHKK